MGIETLDKSKLPEIDKTYGYNDYLIFLNDQNTVWANDQVTEKDGTDVLNPSKILSGSEGDVQKMVKPGDQLFQLPNKALLLRRSVFTDTCLAGNPRPNNTIPLSEPMARAMAFFGASYQGSDPSGELWCRRVVPGTAGNIETPWNVSSMVDLRSIEEVLSRIRSARAGNLPSDLQPGQLALAKELAAAVTDADMNSVTADIKIRHERLEGFGDWFMKHPILHTLGIAVLFGLGTDAYHLTRYLIAGGKSPFEGPFSIFGGIRSLIRGIRKLFGKDPKDPPPGGSGGGGGNQDLPVIAAKDIPAGAAEAGGYVVQNGVTLGVVDMKRVVTSEKTPVVSGEIDTNAGDKTTITPVPDFGVNWDEEPTREWVALPDGVVPLDAGAFIYRYQATINGNIVGLSETVARNLAKAQGLTFDANSFFFAGDFAYDQFLTLATSSSVVIASPVVTAEPSADDIVRSLGVKGPKAIVPGAVAKLSSKKEAANSAVEHMTTGKGNSVTGFSTSGTGVGVTVPAYRVAPIRVTVP